MSFQAYLDKIEEITGKTPQILIDEINAAKLTKHKEIVDWLKAKYGLGLGHARALAHVVLHGPDFTVTHKTGTHRDESGTLVLTGKKKPK